MYDIMVLKNVIMNYFAGLGHFFAEWVLYVLLVFNHSLTLPSYYLTDINEHYLLHVCKLCGQQRANIYHIYHKN